MTMQSSPKFEIEWIFESVRSIDGLSLQVLYNAHHQSPNISLSVSYIVKPVSRSYFWTMDHEVKLTPSVQSGAVRSWKSSLNREGLQRRQ